MNKKRLYRIIKNAINAYESELDNQGYSDEEEMHKVLLNEFGMTENDYQRIMFGKEKRESDLVEKTD